MKMKSKKIASVSNNCVACGICEKLCPFNAINVFKGMYALVDVEKCVGCGKCAKNCPAQIITITERSDKLEK